MKHNRSANPIHKKIDGNWYFWDEYWAKEYGPYNTEQGANDAWSKYCIEAELFQED